MAVLKKRREAERVELPVSSLDKFFGGQFEWYGSDPRVIVVGFELDATSFDSLLSWKGKSEVTSRH